MIICFHLPRRLVLGRFTHLRSSFLHLVLGLAYPTNVICNTKTAHDRPSICIIITQNHKQRDPMDSLEPLPWRPSSNMNRQNDALKCSANQHPQPPTAIQQIGAPDHLDVVGGRGQGVQRLPGNLRFRKLVSMNKVR